MLRTLNRLLLFVGGMCAAVSWWAFAAQQTVFNPTATREAAAGLLAIGPVQDSAVRSISQQVLRALPPGTDPRTADAVARKAVTDARVRTAFADAAASVHEQLLERGGTSQELVVDTSTVTAALKTALWQADPAMMSHFRAKEVTMRFDTRNFPNLHGARVAAPRVARTAFSFAIVAWMLAFAAGAGRLVTARRIGRRLVGIGFTPVMFWIVVPAVVRLLHLPIAAGLTPVAHSYSQRLVTPAVVIVGIGATMWIAGWIAGPALRWLRRNRNGFRVDDVVVPFPARSGPTWRASEHWPLRATGSDSDRIDMHL